ncbi:MAG: LD-carboxypeptidase, partial [Rhizobiaceae bacterium]|nr:LD-carboxypeptidase [Rhizobiaceae bacterium]
DFGEHAFSKQDYLAGSDEQRLADLNLALRDPDIRAIFATRGGKGSYRISDRLDFDAVRRDPKWLVGFSDITSLHLSLWTHCRQLGIHGALFSDDEKDGSVATETSTSLRNLLMASPEITIRSRPEEPTAALTTTGLASGRLIGGNLEIVSTSVGWALPDMRGAILLLEAVNMFRSQVDRQLTMLRKGGYLDGLAGIAIGQFTGFEFDRRFSVIDILREHFEPLDIPVLGGLPLGHGPRPLSVPIGAKVRLDADERTLMVLPER